MKKIYFLILFVLIVLSASARKKYAYSEPIFGTPYLLFTGEYESSNMKPNNGYFHIAVKEGEQYYSIVKIGKSNNSPSCVIQGKMDPFGKPWSITAKQYSFSYVKGSKYVFKFQEGTITNPKLSFEQLTLTLHVSGKKGSVINDITIEIDGLPEQLQNNTTREFNPTVLNWLVGARKGLELINSYSHRQFVGNGTFQIIPNGHLDIVLDHFTEHGFDCNTNIQRFLVDGMVCYDNAGELVYKQKESNLQPRIIQSTIINFPGKITKDEGMLFTLVSDDTYNYLGGSINKGEKYSIIYDNANRIIALTSKGDSLVLLNTEGPVDICNSNNYQINTDNNAKWIKVTKVYHRGRWEEIAEEQPWLTKSEFLEIKRKKEEQARREREERERQERLAREEAERQARIEQERKEREEAEEQRKKEAKWQAFYKKYGKENVEEWKDLNIKIGAPIAMLNDQSLRKLFDEGVKEQSYYVNDGWAIRLGDWSYTFRHRYNSGGIAYYEWNIYVRVRGEDHLIKSVDIEARYGKVINTNITLYDY